MNHFFTRYLSDLVYGANDGIITTFAIVASAAGASLEVSVLLILGFANLLADGFSMGSSSYLSVSSERDVDRVHGNDTSEDRPLRSGVVTFGAFVLAGILPLLPFLFPTGALLSPYQLSLAATGLAFFLIGGARSFITRRSFLTSGLEMLLVGGVAAGIAFSVGWFIEGLV
ncbi:hypothetical protein GVX82_00010 [Patescibacteria group bacterium]|jgi:VIT1/CCC1 family predicted Fe2+/Mn2+ transporter|nr:hypothetical protein [Patescibacteria group bacterium]